jgi:hypothetical protein
MWMSEQGYTSEPEHIYAIVREPKEHVLSMYFHCKEAKEHKGKKSMPSLDVWLDTWVDAIGNQTQKQVSARKRFGCNYNPINHQSNFVQFDPDKADKGKEDLKSRYDVIGDNAQMVKSVCVIFIRYTGWVPKECDCSTASSNALSIESNLTAAVNVSSSSARRQLRDRHSSSSRRRLGLAYDTAKHSHGVTHHGATFNTTELQDQAIAKLRDVDSLLYNISREVFKEQVQEVEEEYQIKVCDQFREQRRR